MKFFKDANGTVYAFESDGSQDEYIPSELVSITQAEADNLRFQPQTLADAQTSQIASMARSYAGAIAQDITFTTAAAVSKVFQADEQSVSNAQAMLSAYGASGVPSGFYWVAKDDTQVPFTLTDLQGLAKTMGDQGWSAFQRLQARKASILAAGTIAEVQAVTW
jgi:hypothetical protein